MAVVALSNKSPYYITREVDWVMMRDAYSGERAIKDKMEQYLPPTQTMLLDGMSFNQQGWQMYQAYRTRAVYHEMVKPALMAMLGVMHRKPPEVKLPAKLEPMRERATFNGESLHWLIQKINEQQMLMGRYGLLLDVATQDPNKSNPLALPYVVGYNTESIINWDSSKASDDQGLRQLQFVVLNESTYARRNGLQWVLEQRYRVLGQSNKVRDAWPDIPVDDGPNGKYVAANVIQTEHLPDQEFYAPTLAGRELESIPFVFVGPRDLVPEPDMPVLMPLARIGLAIYRTEADYRQALYMQGQDTMVIIGQQATTDNSRTRIGAYGVIELPVNGDAKYVGSSRGLGDFENAIQNDMKRAAQLGAQLLSERGNEAEAGNALQIRVASRTATLTTVAQCGAAALEQILKHAATWVGADPNQVKVTPNLDFADDPAQAQDLVYVQTAKNMGFPISEESIHAWAKKREFTVKTYEEELAARDKEEPLLIAPPTVPGARGVAPPDNNTKRAGTFPKKKAGQ